ncbi:hypothetical protein ACVXHB_16930 [Escherichia coli]
MKMIEVVAAIIERDGKFYSLTPRPERSGGDYGSLPVEVELDESQRQQLRCASYAKNWASKQLLGEYVASHQREVSVG